MQPSFSPDTPLVAAVQASPNHGERKGVSDPDIVVLHYTGMKSADAAVEWLCDPASEVSSHYLVFEDGRILQMVPESRRAWHAGISSWEGKIDINSYSIGIEIANPGHDFDYPPFPKLQIKAVIALCSDIVARHKIRADRILAHSDIAPARKQDPGEKFPWGQLHVAGLGHWIRPAPITQGEALKRGARGEKVYALQQQLERYGYDVTVNGNYDRATEEVITAFQRHYRPSRVDGIADASTRITLRKLLATRPIVAA
jgi:N-acetylmuramoyl-L-alanine amidase